jgi:hypothetical protein
MISFSPSFSLRVLSRCPLYLALTYSSCYCSDEERLKYGGYDGQALACYDSGLHNNVGDLL